MSKKSLTSILIVMVTGVVVLSACAPGVAGNAVNGVVSSNGTENPAMQTGPISTGADKSGAGAASGDNAYLPAETIPALNLVYTDTTNKFSVGYPSTFAVRTRSADQLNVFNPMPASAILFMNPSAALSQVPDEPGDLEIRVFYPIEIPAINDWLKSVGLTTSNEKNLMYNTDNASGVKVCRSDMLAPNCSYFFYGNNRVYQLISMTQTGDAMLNTFKILP
jgi:hypothetical protein